MKVFAATDGPFMFLEGGTRVTQREDVARVAAFGMRRRGAAPSICCIEVNEENLTFPPEIQPALPDGAWMTLRSGVVTNDARVLDMRTTRARSGPLSRSPETAPDWDEVHLCAQTIGLVIACPEACSARAVQGPHTHLAHGVIWPLEDRTLLKPWQVLRLLARFLITPPARRFSADFGKNELPPSTAAVEERRTRYLTMVMLYWLGFDWKAYAERNIVTPHRGQSEPLTKGILSPKLFRPVWKMADAVRYHREISPTKTAAK